MLCPNCGHEQNAGNLCDKCGSAFDQDEANSEVEIPNEDQKENSSSSNDSHLSPAVQEVQSAQAETATAKAQTVGTDDHVEKVKEKSKQYWNYFLHFLKHPTKIFEMQNSEWVNALISIGIFVLFVSWTPILLVRSFIRGGFGDMGFLFIKEVAGYFITGFISIFIFSLLSIAIVTFSLFIISKFFGPNISYKDIISHYGALFNPALILIILSFLLVLLKSQFIGTMLLTIALVIALSVVPLYLMGKYLAKESKLIDPFYAFLLYMVLSVTLFSIVSGIIMDTTAGSIFNQLF
ncbi:CHY zinc finger protein [Bacillus niameyensis]|uniref:DUF6574 domain-containing protein n=1 Tax=Bacillus niameyensis TaxID=1522308 RepID=UPI0007828C24|nr:DUF6574 domain-containing protein [Bacillus niameyensis]